MYANPHWAITIPPTLKKLFNIKNVKMSKCQCFEVVILCLYSQEMSPKKIHLRGEGQQRCNQ